MISVEWKWISAGEEEVLVELDETQRCALNNASCLCENRAAGGNSDLQLHSEITVKSLQDQIEEYLQPLKYVEKKPAVAKERSSSEKGGERTLTTSTPNDDGQPVMVALFVDFGQNAYPPVRMHPSQTIEFYAQRWRRLSATNSLGSAPEGSVGGPINSDPNLKLKILGTCFKVDKSRAVCNLSASVAPRKNTGGDELGLNLFDSDDDDGSAAARARSRVLAAGRKAPPWGAGKKTPASASKMPVPAKVPVKAPVKAPVGYSSWHRSLFE